MLRKRTRLSGTLSDEIVDRSNRANRRAGFMKRKRPKRTQTIIRFEQEADVIDRLHVAERHGHASTLRGSISVPLNGNTSHRMRNGNPKSQKQDNENKQKKEKEKAIYAEK